MKGRTQLVKWRTLYTGKPDNFCDKPRNCLLKFLPFRIRGSVLEWNFPRDPYLRQAQREQVARESCATQLHNSNAYTKQTHLLDRRAAAAAATAAGTELGTRYGSRHRRIIVIMVEFSNLLMRYGEGGFQLLHLFLPYAQFDVTFLVQFH